MTDSLSPALKRNVTKLQKAIVDGLEDVKAQDIQVFDTEHLTSLFERVVVASGTSNRQTKALAASVRDAVREAGFDKPRIEGEDNGEWIIVDCGAAVVHIMQPSIRQYYHLEELWGEKPVKSRAVRATKPSAKAANPPAAEQAGPRKRAAGQAQGQAAPAKKPTAAKKSGAVKKTATRSVKPAPASPVGRPPAAAKKRSAPSASARKSPRKTGPASP